MVRIFRLFHWNQCNVQPKTGQIDIPRKEISILLNEIPFLKDLQTLSLKTESFQRDFCQKRLAFSKAIVYINSWSFRRSIKSFVCIFSQCCYSFEKALAQKVSINRIEVQRKICNLWNSQNFFSLIALKLLIF